MKAKKHLGQNFITSTQIVSDVVAAGKITPGDIVLEIGPGKGILTKKILEKGAIVFAIEKDFDLIPKLSKVFTEEIQNNTLKIIQGDILEESILENLPLEKNKYKVVANIPYYITGQILRLFLSNTKKPLSVTLIVQKEVAERIVCKDGKESILSLSVKAFGKPSYIRKISARYFKPKPKVDSAIINIESFSKNIFTTTKEEELFFELIKTGFSHKRKILLKNLTFIFNKELLEKAFTACDIAQKTRAENVSFNKWLCLLKNLKSK